MASARSKSKEQILSARSLLFEQVAQAPYQFDFYHLLRRLEGLQPDKPRFGHAQRPNEETVRLAQEPALTFAPSNISAIDYNGDGVARISVRFLGLFGPQGPLPTHLTELARERMHSHSDPTLARFADLFHHRMLLLFYRAWRQAQPAASRDQPQHDRFHSYIGALFGQAGGGWRNRDSIADESKRQFAAHLARSAKNADGLANLLTAYFNVPVTVNSFSPQWLTMPQEADYLRRYDTFRTQIAAIVEMPDRTIDLLFRLLRQNGGRLSKRALDSEFSQLTQPEAAKIEAAYAQSFLAG